MTHTIARQAGEDIQFRSDAEESPDIMLDIIQVQAIRWGNVEEYQSSRWMFRSQDMDGTVGTAGHPQRASAGVTGVQVRQPVASKQRTGGGPSRYPIRNVHVQKGWQCEGLDTREKSAQPWWYVSRTNESINWWGNAGVKYKPWISNFDGFAPLDSRRGNASMGISLIPPPDTQVATLFTQEEEEMDRIGQNKPIVPSSSTTGQIKDRCMCVSLILHDQ